MYISVYDERSRHVANLADVSYDKTVRVYDMDSFSAEGVSGDALRDGKIVVLNDEEGNYKYACFLDGVTTDGEHQKLKGLDFKTIWDTDILLDFTQEGSFDGRLSAIFQAVKSAVFDNRDTATQEIPVEVIIPEDPTDTTALIESYQGTYKVVNAYSFLKAYLKNYEYNIESRYDVASGKIVFSFVKCSVIESINLADFIHELTTTSAATNKTIATITYDVKTPQTDYDGNVIYTDVQETDADGNPKWDENGYPIYVPKYKPRPDTIAMRCYYRNAENQIVQSDEFGEIPGRLYPVRTRIFEAEYLADAQFEAVYELANARYVDNIVIDSNAMIDPIDLSQLPLYAKIKLYYDGVLYKTLPISEKTTKCDGKGENTKIKLGFKKILLTEIIKA